MGWKSMLPLFHPSGFIEFLQREMQENLACYSLLLLLVFAQSGGANFDECCIVCPSGSGRQISVGIFFKPALLFICVTHPLGKVSLMWQQANILVQHIIFGGHMCLISVVWCSPSGTACSWVKQFVFSSVLP